jgi:hypothetical protein
MTQLHDIFDPAMQDTRVEALVHAFNTSLRPEIDAAWVVANSIGDDLLPLFAEAFPQIRKWGGRASIIRYVGKFSRQSDVAFKLGEVAVRDRAYDVRHYGCALLAYSLRAEALPTLHTLLRHANRRTVEDAKAAIDAIKSKNHNLFRDRGHSGKVLWEYGSV